MLSALFNHPIPSYAISNLDNDTACADGHKTVVALDGHSFTDSITQDGTYGTLTLYSNGTYKYMPLSTILGEPVADTFTYTMQDNDGTQSTATLTITINDLNQPTAVPDVPDAKNHINTVNEQDLLTQPIGVSTPGNVLDNDSSGNDGYANPKIVNLTYDNNSHPFGYATVDTSNPDLFTVTSDTNDWKLTLDTHTGQYTFTLDMHDINAGSLS